MSKYLDKAGVSVLWNAVKKRIDDAKTESQASSDDVKSMVVKLHAQINMGVNPSVIEKGVETNVSVTHSALFDGKALNYELKVDGAALANPYKVSDTRTFNGVFEIDNADPKLVTEISKQATVRAYYPKYYGGSTKTALTGADVVAMTKQAIAAGAAGTVPVTTGEGEYVWFCVPSGMSISKITLGGFGVPLEDAVDVTVEGKGVYKCYRTSNPLSAGTRSFVIA